MKQIICINCEEKGHMFRDCMKPIISYGVLAFRKNKKTKDIEYLMVQRKDTIGFIDFLRGKICKKFSEEYSYKTLIEEMTIDEKNKILTKPFNELWDTLWMNNKAKLYTNEYQNAKNKFYNLDILNMVKSTDSKWNSQEFCIPKGRKNRSENSFSCALREFCEETGYSRKNILFCSKNFCLSEYFLGSNGTTYKHIYLIAQMDNSEIPEINYNNISQSGEIRMVKWFNFKNCINSFREYMHTKRNIIYKSIPIINDILHGNYNEY